MCTHCILPLLIFKIHQIQCHATKFKTSARDVNLKYFSVAFFYSSKIFNFWCQFFYSFFFWKFSVPFSLYWYFWLRTILVDNSVFVVLLNFYCKLKVEKKNFFWNHNPEWSIFRSMLNCVNNLNLEPQSMNSGIERAALMVSEEKQDSRKNFITSHCH